MSYRVGIDVGGTFTDTVMLDSAGRLTNIKLLSTPPTYVGAMEDSIKRLGVPAGGIEIFVHGTTVATNAILQKRGGKVGLITTKGFRDVLELRRGTREKNWDLQWSPPPVLVKRRHRFEVPERIDYRGNVIEPLDERAARDAVAVLRDRGLDSVAICFINSYVNPEHERIMERIVREEFPDAAICISYDVNPEILEFERTSTTVANAFLLKVVDDYLSTLETALANLGFTKDILIISSSGGALTPGEARRIPVAIATSGAVGGVVASQAVAEAAGQERVIAMDVGGTTCQATLIFDGRPATTHEWNPEFGLPVRYPSLDAKMIGAAGGTVAWIDRGLLRSGPQSAAADPGPACYGKGGRAPTNTDAQVVLGRISPDAWTRHHGWGLDVEAAKGAIQSKIAEPLDMDITEAARAVVSLQKHNVANNIKLISTHRGYDPTDFALLAFGGAGPQIALSIAKEMNLASAIIPRNPGLFTALGLLLIDVRFEVSRTILEELDKTPPSRLNEVFVELEKKITDALSREGVESSRIRLERLMDLKYVGQSARYLTVPIRTGEFTDKDLAEVTGRFESMHEREYGWILKRPYGIIQIKGARVVGIGLIQRPNLEMAFAPKAEARGPAPIGHRRVFFDEANDFVDTDIYEREDLPSQSEIEGPAVIEQLDSTVVVPPGITVAVDRLHNLRAKLR